MDLLLDLINANILPYLFKVLSVKVQPREAGGRTPRMEIHVHVYMCVYVSHTYMYRYTVIYVIEE